MQDKTDDGLRGGFGIVTSLAVRDDGSCRVVLDRVRRSKNGWRHVGFSTFKEFTLARLNDLSIPDEDLMNLGLFVLAELVGARETSAQDLSGDGNTKDT